ncbi:hypothetical protein P8605_40490 [Streptomyces sp. T-3]|nr:hypothetical protein [Streptomyces sp. T-3]
MTWSEAEYVACLEGERRCYAWVMRQYGGMPPDRARAAALESYPYEPSTEPHRGLVFHDEAWHWAMLTLHGSGYWAAHPELADPPPEYRALD